MARGRRWSCMADWRTLDEFLAGYSIADSTRMDRCREFWLSKQRDQWGEILLEVLARYRTIRQCGDPTMVTVSFALNELTTSCYQLRPKLTEAAALAVLRTAFHTCGHGADTQPPLDLALAHFRNKPYNADLFAAVHAYRAALSHTRNTTAQQLKAKLEFILWQDWSHQKKWKTCWTAHIRADVARMPAQERQRWSRLFQQFQLLPHIEPTKKWIAACRPALEELSRRAFCDRVAEWMGSSGPLAEQRASLSTPGSHALKNLIWCAAVTEDASLDTSFLPLVDIRWKNPGPLTKVAGALAYLWSRRDPRMAVQALERIAKPFAYPGGKIEHYYREARIAAGS